MAEAMDATPTPKTKKPYRSASATERFHTILEESRDRLLQQIRAMSDRTNFSFTIGIMLCFFGIFLLPYYFASHPKNKEWVEFMISFLPIISCILLIEAFAYYFLRLYRQGLNDIRYFQNEITNIELKYLVIVMSEKCTPEQIDVIIQSLATSERNFVLQKDQRVASEVLEAPVQPAMEKYMSMLKDLVPGRNK